MNKEEVRKALLSARIKKFYREVRDNPSWAVPIPDEIVDLTEVGKAEEVFEKLRNAGLRQRKDGKWEIA